MRNQVNNVSNVGITPIAVSRYTKGWLFGVIPTNSKEIVMKKLFVITAMKRASLILLLVVSLVLSICVSQKPMSAGSSNKVLLILRERLDSADKQYLGTNEAVMMKSMLEEAGFTVVIASASGRTFLVEDITLESDLTLAEVKIADYAGFIIPCLALGTSVVKPEEVAIAKQIVAEGKPVAAQRKGVLILAESGVLAGKRYSYKHDILSAEGIYSGKGVVQDGKIITSAYCPYHGSLDQTVELTQALIAEAEHQSQSKSSDTDQPVVIFEIGQEDKNYSEFCVRGFKGHSEYTCRVGVDCSSEAFPRRLYRAPISAYIDDGVERITIIFTLDRTYNNAVLRLVRAGNETTVVTVDGKQERTHRVTDTMLESGDGYTVGVYDLTLGALKKGTHTIQLSVADDGKGNGRYSWDALTLFAE